MIEATSQAGERWLNGTGKPLRFAARFEQARAARGLVSVSTSGFAVKATLPAAIAWAENCITIDRAQARVTRLRKGVGVASKALLNLSEGVAENNVMVTLTYDLKKAKRALFDVGPVHPSKLAFHAYWAPRHVSDYIRKVRAWFKERCPGEKLRYLWVAELQERGVLHYHAVFFLPRGVAMPKADRVGWWPHGMSNTLKANKPVAYLMKYASKSDSKSIGGFPRGARIYGVGGLDAPGAAFKRWVLWPAYVQGNASVTDRFRPAPGGGYRNDETGELLLSEFAPTGSGFSSFIRVRKTPRAIEACGPFSWFTNSAGVEAAGYLH